MENGAELKIEVSILEKDLADTRRDDTSGSGAAYSKRGYWRAVKY